MLIPNPHNCILECVGTRVCTAVCCGDPQGCRAPGPALGLSPRSQLSDPVPQGMAGSHILQGLDAVASQWIPLSRGHQRLGLGCIVKPLIPRRGPLYAPLTGAIVQGGRSAAYLLAPPLHRRPGGPTDCSHERQPHRVTAVGVPLSPVPNNSAACSGSSGNYK